MRKRQLTYGAMAALSLTLGMTSCQSELSELTPSGGERIILTATQDEEAGTRTYLDNDRQVVWGEGDALSVFDAQGINQPFELTNGFGTTTAKFEGTVSANCVTNYYAVYPYSEGYAISSGTVTGVTLPAEQTAVAGGFDKAAAIMTCHTTTGNLPFKQLCAFVQITTESATKKIIFKTNGTESLAGTLNVAIAADGIGTATVASNGTGTVTLLPDGSTTIAAGTYLIAVLPGTLEEGFTMECVGTDDNELVRSYNGTTSVLSRAAVINMGTASVSEGWTSQAYHECTHTYAKGAYAPTANNGTGEAGTDWVDLGISVGGKKILFATRNLGAEHEYDYGDYYAWGATEPWCIGYHQNGTTLTASNAAVYLSRHWQDGKSGGYAQANAPFYNGSAYTKYTATPATLAAEDDAASVQWGADWRMPTAEEMKALYDNTTNVRTADYNNTGIAGCIFTGNGDYANSSLFLPAAGYFNGTSFYDGGSGGYYWSSTLFSSTGGRFLGFNSGSVNPQDLSNRYYGFSVRAVRAVSE